jgi:radical SAM family uncharacterized protein
MNSPADRMSRLALSDRILLSIDKPARYIGNEFHCIIKDKSLTSVRFAMCFPDVYEIGMSHLGIQIIYEELNRMPDVWCERVYSPWTDLHRIMKEQKIPLFALESQDPVKDFDFLGITIQYEMCYTNILQILDLSGIPLHSCDRTDFSVPLVIGGGPCAYNPEPLAEFFDLFYIGESEVRYRELFDIYKQARKDGISRKEFLIRASRIPGIYVPSLYEASYGEDGTLSSFAPVMESVPEKVERQCVSDFAGSPYPKHPIVPFLRPIQDRVTLEIQRGCIRGCRFCQAGMIYRPLRERNLEDLEAYADEMLSCTGYDEISLSSLSSSDYRYLPELLDYLIRTTREKNVNISLPSLRIDAFSLDVMKKVQDIRKSSLTFAPEAGTQRMRDVINKGITEEDILNGSAEAFRGGWKKVKLYFMLGLPTETEEDREAIADVAEKIAETYYDTVPKEERHGKCEISVSTSFFIPKPFTPLQWEPMHRAEDYVAFAHTVLTSIHSKLNQRAIHYSWHEPDVSVLEGVLARGDRRLSAVIEKAYENGALFDSWSDLFKPEAWSKAFADCGIDPEFYTLRKRSEDELLPWDFIRAGVTKEFLLKEKHQAEAGLVTPNCREKCSACGAARCKGGVCLEDKG